MLAALSLGKRPNLKPWRLVLPPSLEHVNGFLLKFTVLEVDLLQDHQDTLFGGVYVCTFQPGNFYRLWQWRGWKRFTTALWLTGRSVSKRVNWFLDFNVRESIGQGRQGLQVQSLRLRGTNHALKVFLHHFQTRVSRSQVKAGPQFWKQQSRNS